MVEACLKALEQGYYEVTFAFEGLADENVWKRPAAGLLSVGELAGHIAYGEALRLAGDSEAPETCRVISPLIDPRFQYYPTTIATPPSHSANSPLSAMGRPLANVAARSNPPSRRASPNPATSILHTAPTPSRRWIFFRHGAAVVLRQ